MPKSTQSDLDDYPSARETCNTSFTDILKKRLSRRSLLQNAAMASAHLGMSASLYAKDSTTNQVVSEDVQHGLDDQLSLAKHYDAQVLLRWGDPLFVNENAFDPNNQNAESQLKRFGYNNDFVAFIPISQEKNSSSHGLLVVNHEYVNSSLMHPGSPSPLHLSRQQVDTEMAAHGLSVIEGRKQGVSWVPILDSKFNRRITPKTDTQFSGPASAHERVRTAFSKAGMQAMGTFGNCAGCVTPWGTVLTAEENIQAYFMGNANKTDEIESYKRFGLLGSKTAFSIWGKYHPHWNLDHHPQAGMHAGWVVEVDPFDPQSIPIKRTALGRCKHEGCDVHINIDGKAVVYMGDDQAFEYVYRFVSKDKFIQGERKHNRSLLDDGELSVAEFKDTGIVIWHPLQFGVAPHIKDNGFYSQADVVLDLRKAADLVGATPMDRPEEIKVNPKSGNVFAVFTNNVRRVNTDAANPRAINRHGHILELIPPQQDHSSREYKWDVFILAGDVDSKIDHAHYHNNISSSGWFSSPDNCSFDESGNIWIATDGFNRSGKADGIWVSAADGKHKALSKHFLRVPIGAEVCSPCFTPDFKTMFCSVQHPGDHSSFEQPSTRWPDFNKSMPPRPSVIAVQHTQGKRLLS